MEQKYTIRAGIFSFGERIEDYIFTGFTTLTVARLLDTMLLRAYREWPEYRVGSLADVVYISDSALQYLLKSWRSPSHRLTPRHYSAAYEIMNLYEVRENNVQVEGLKTRLAYGSLVVLNRRVRGQASSRLQRLKDSLKR